jgi:alpha-beta hydrolase superfamily lysophospholipase
MQRIFRHILMSLAVMAVVLSLALVFGGPGAPPPMPSINDPFKDVDFSGLPATSRFLARDGASLAYRAYPAAGGRTMGCVVLVHGSSGSSGGMHVLGKAMASAGYAAYALDIRGHGESGPKGTIAYVGQLEDDLEDFLAAVKPAHPITLAGFSSGGGFALRFAGSARQKLFDNYLLLSPLIGRKAPTFRPDSGGWVRIGLARIIAISMLNAIGVRIFNGLPVLNFALDEKAKAILTPHYSYNLALDFQPQRDYRANIRAMGQPCRLVAGQDDEVFHSDRFAEVFQNEGKDVPVTLVPGVRHIPLILAPAAVQAAVAQVRMMDEAR